jgi:hypothetical protein
VIVLAIESKYALRQMLYTLLKLKKRNKGIEINGLDEEINQVTAVMDKDDIDAVLVKIDELKI